MNTLVSFIIVAYNAQTTLPDLLGDILKQDYIKKNIEILLIDSVSCDKTRNIIETFKVQHQEKFNRILILENPKKTLPCGWNIALKNAKGEIILRVDAHSRFPENFISKNIEYMNQGESITGGPRESIVDEYDNSQKLLLLAESSLFGSGIAAYRHQQKTGYVKSLAHAAYRKKIFEDVGLYNENLARTEDNEMHYRMRKKGYKFYFNPEIKTYHHARNGLKKMITQKFLNGFWIGKTLIISPKCFSIYHLVPFAFVLSLIISLFLCLFSISWPFLGLILSYLACNLTLSVISIWNQNFIPNFVLLPFIFFILHISYGFGTLFGLISAIFNGKKK